MSLWLHSLSWEFGVRSREFGVGSLELGVGSPVNGMELKLHSLSWELRVGSLELGVPQRDGAETPFAVSRRREGEWLWRTIFDGWKNKS